MKAIIQINKKSLLSDDLEVFASNLLELKICGKTLFSYYFEFLNELGANSIYILGEGLSSYVDDYYKSEVFPASLEFHSQDIEQFCSENEPILKEDKLLIIKGIGFIFNSFYSLKEKIYWGEKNFIVKDKEFILEYKNDLKEKTSSSNNILIRQISDLKDYVYVLDYILKRLNKVDYTAGYSKKDGIIIGKNVKIDKSVKLEAPLVLLDNVKLSENCIIGPNVIISNNVFIENNTQIKDSFICENTYVGQNLELENKIVIENKIIDKSSLKEYLIDKKLLSNNK